jgi:hypothetical protein
MVDWALLLLRNAEFPMLAGPFYDFPQSLQSPYNDKKLKPSLIGSRIKIYSRKSFRRQTKLDYRNGRLNLLSGTTSIIPFILRRPADNI